MANSNQVFDLMSTSHFNHFLTLLQDESKVDAIEHWEVVLKAQARHVLLTRARYEGSLFKRLNGELLPSVKLMPLGKPVEEDWLWNSLEDEWRAMWGEEYDEEDYGEAYQYETRPDDYGVNHSSYYCCSLNCYDSSSDESDDDFVDRAELEEEAQQYAEEYYAQQEEEKRRKREAANERAEEDEDDYECYYDEFDHESSLRAEVARHSHKSFDCDW